MDTRDQKNDLKGLGTITTPALIVGGAKDVVDDFLFAVSYKEKDFLVPNYMANAMNKLLHDLAEIKEKCMAQLKKERHHSTHNVGNHTVATYGTTEDVAAKLNNIIISLLEKSRETPIDVGPGQPHMTIEEALKTSELEIMQDNFLSDVLKWMAAHPYATAFHIAMALLMLCPGLAVVPLLEMVGFGGEGIIAGKSKSTMHEEILGSPLLIENRIGRRVIPVSRRPDCRTLTFRCSPKYSHGRVRRIQGICSNASRDRLSCYFRGRKSKDATWLSGEAFLDPSWVW